VPESKLKKPFQGMLDGEKEPYSPMELVINSKKKDLLALLDKK